MFMLISLEKCYRILLESLHERVYCARILENSQIFGFGAFVRIIISVTVSIPVSEERLRHLILPDMGQKMFDHSRSSAA